MNIYLFGITSNDDWEISEGVYVVSAPTKKQAIKIAKKEMRGFDIVFVKLLKSTKQKVLFKQDPTIQ